MRTPFSSRLVLALVVALAAFLTFAPGAAQAQCGQEYRGRPASSNVPGGPPLAIGDSVLADAVPGLVALGFEADGMVCRQMSQGIQILAERRATLPHLVLLALGANGEVTPSQIEEALTLVGPQRVLVLVTPHGSPVASAASVVRESGPRHPGRIVVLDWDRLALEHRDWLAPDGVHLGGQAGIRGFTNLLAGALAYADGKAPRTPAATTPGPEVRAPATVGVPETIQPSPTGSSATTPLPPASAPGDGTAATTPTVPALPGTLVPAREAGRADRSSDATPVVGWVALGVLLLALVGAGAWRLRRRRAAPG